MNDVIKLASPHQPVFATGYGIAGTKGDPVVLLHCSMSHKGQWQQLAGQLAVRHRIIAVDLIGYGDSISREPGGQFTLADEAKQVAAVIGEVCGSDSPFHLVGHSYGGCVALRLARELPSRVASLALYEPTAFHVLPENDSARDEIGMLAGAMRLDLKRGERAAAAEVFIDYWAGENAYAKLPQHLQTLFAYQVEKALSDFRALCEEPATLADYGRLAMPVCLIAGRLSPLSSRRVAAALARSFARGELHWIAGGHTSPISQPEIVNPIVARFLAESAAYFGLNPEARLRASGHPNCGERIARAA